MRKVMIGSALIQAMVLVMALMCANAHATVQNTIYDFAGAGAGTYDPGSLVSFSGWIEVDVTNTIQGGEVLFTLDGETNQTLAFQEDMIFPQPVPGIHAMVLTIPNVGYHASLFLFDPAALSGANQATWDISLFQAFANSTEYMGALSSFTARATPIPGAVWLLGSGIAGLAWVRRKFQA